MEKEKKEKVLVNRNLKLVTARITKKKIIAQNSEGHEKWRMSGSGSDFATCLNRYIKCSS